MNRVHCSFLLLALALVCGQGAWASGPAPTRQQTRFEVRFLTSMIDHHYGAVKMADLCQGRTVHSELQQMCENIRSSQTEEIAKMQQWLQDWYGVSHTPELDSSTSRHIERLSRESGEEFEIMFMTEMIQHHAMAARMGVDCLLRAYHAEMLNMCAMMLGAQGDEIAQMRMWLCQWYSLCDLSENHWH